MKLTTDQVRAMGEERMNAIEETMVDISGSDGSLYRVVKEGDSWIVVTSRGGTIYKVGGYSDLATAMGTIIGIADDREGACG